MMIRVSMLTLAAVCGVGLFYAPAALAHAGDASTASEAPGPEGGSKFVNMDPLTLPVIDGTGVVSNISLDIVLECDEKKEDDIKKKLPLLTDAYIQNLYGSLNKHDALKDGVLQVALIKSRLSAITNKVMGDGQVTNVLLQVVQQRPI